MGLQEVQLVSSVASQQKGCGFNSQLGVFYMEFACFISCMCGFSSDTLVSSNSLKTCTLNYLAALNPSVWRDVCHFVSFWHIPASGPMTAGDQHQLPATLNWNKQFKEMNGFF